VVFGCAIVWGLAEGHLADNLAPEAHEGIIWTAPVGHPNQERIRVGVAEMVHVQFCSSARVQNVVRSVP